VNGIEGTEEKTDFLGLVHSVELIRASV
jgi:hypothetical protein